MTGNRYLFGTLAPSMGLIDILLDHVIAKRPETRRLVVIGRDDVFPRAMAAGMADRAAKRGLQLMQRGHGRCSTNGRCAPLLAPRR